MKIRIGDFERYGTKKTTDGMMFTFALSTEEDCAICLYDRKNKTLIEEIALPEAYRIGQVYSVELIGSKWERYCYRIRQGKQLFVDPYARSIAGREVWNDTMRFGQDDGCYGAFDVTYELPAQRGRWIKAQDMVMYKLHSLGSLLWSFSHFMNLRKCSTKKARTSMKMEIVLLHVFHRKKQITGAMVMLIILLQKHLILEGYKPHSAAVR